MENSETPTAPRRLRARAVLLGVLWIPLICYACTNQQASTYFSLIVAPVSAMIIMVLTNGLLKLVFRRAPLTSADLIVVYCITSVTAAISSEWIFVHHSAMHVMPIQAQYNPTFRDGLMPNTPDWLGIHDLAKVSDIPAGGRDLRYVLSKFPMYWPIYLGWGTILFLFLSMMMFANSIMRKAWTQTERLSFPIIQLPLEMAGSGPTSMWRSKAMWVAFGLMFAIDILNGLNYLYPSIPQVPVKEFINLESLFKDPPLSNIGYFPISIYPFMAALGLFMPSDLLFSVVFFFLVRKLTNVVLAAQGIPQGWFSGTAVQPGPPYWDEQTWGAVLALFLAAMWVSRGHLKQVWRDVFTGARDEDGGISYRWAFAGLVASFSALVGIASVVGGLPPGFSMLYMALVLVFGVVISRVRAQLGPPTHEFAFFGPNSLMFRLFGTQWINDKQATFLSQTMLTVNRIHRTHPMPYQLEAMKMASTQRLHQGQLFKILMLASPLAILCAYVGLHAWVYRTAQPYTWPDAEVYFRNIRESPHGVDAHGLAMTALGFVFVLGLDFIRTRFSWFPLHPVGYLLSANFGVDYYWFGLLLALLVKSFITRYFGLPGYKHLRHVALGILLAEYSAETLWMTISLITGHSTYTISFNERGLSGQ